MFEQMMIDCAKEGSFGRLDNKLIAKGLLASLLEAFGRCNAAKVRARCAVAISIFFFLCRRPVNCRKIGLAARVSLMTQQSGY